MYSVIQGGRQSGKTHRTMTEIHDLVVAGRGRDVLVVFPNMQYVHWWTREWNARFPHVPMIDYTSVSNMLKIRGRHYAKVYVEDVDTLPDGIHSEKLHALLPSLRSPIYNDAEIVFTSSLIDLNQKTHNKIVRRSDILRRLIADARRAKEVQNMLEIAAMRAYIALHEQEDDGDHLG